MIIACVGLASLVAASTYALRTMSSSEPAGARPRPLASQRSDRGAIAATTTQREEQAWPVGQQRTYALDFGSASKGGSDSSAEGVFGTGKLSLVAQQADESGVILQGAFSELGFFAPPETEGAATSRSPGNEQRLSAELARPFLAFLTRAGAVEWISVDPALGDASLAFVRGFLATLQFVAPTGPNPTWNRWTSVETDNFGVCAARYERIGDDLFKKTKTDYRQLEMSNALKSADETRPQSEPRIWSEATILLRQGGVVGRAAMVETVTVALGEMSVETKSHVTLELASASRIEVVPLTPKGWTRERLFATRDPSPEERLESLRRQLGAATFADLLTDLVALRKTQASASQRWDVIDRLAALFQLRPDALRDALSAMKGPLGREDAELMLAALAHTKTPDSQAALGTLAADSAVEAGLRRSAVVRLGLDEAPTEGTLDALDRLSKNADDAGLRETALLALGGAARQAADAESTTGVAQKTIRALERDLGAAGSVERRTLLLSALGNTGSPDVLSTLRTQLSDADPRIRSAAINALRLIPGPEVEALLSAAVARDPDALVRRSAVDTLGGRPLTATTLDALLTALRSDADGMVRLGVVGAIAGQVGSSPVVRAALDAAGTHDPDVEVRKAAARALNPPPGKGG